MEAITLYAKLPNEQEGPTQIKAEVAQRTAKLVSEGKKGRTLNM